MQSEARDKSVSMTKGVAIILMVLAHTGFSRLGDSYINMFHMPLFFFFSGYCFKNVYLNDFQGYFIKRMKGAYWPFVKWGLIFLLLHNVFFALNIYNGEYGFNGKVSQVYTITDFLKNGAFIVASMSHAERLLGGYWFLHTYFFAAFFTFFTIWLFKKMKMPTITGGGILLLAGTLMLVFNLWIPYYIGAQELLASSFMVTGFAYKESNWHLEQRSIIVFAIGATVVAIGVMLCPCSMLSLTWQKIIPYFFTAMFGIFMVFAFCKWLCRFELPARCLSFVGDRTLDILTWHFLSFKLVSLIIILCYGLSIERLAEFPVVEDYTTKGWWILYLTIGIIVPIMIGLIFQKAQNGLKKLLFANKKVK